MGDAGERRQRPEATIAGAGSTIIDANEIDRVITVHAGLTASISGVTVRNGLADGGGGIQPRDRQRLQLDDRLQPG